MVHLEGALKEARAHLKNEIILEMINADDIDLIVENDKVVKPGINTINKTFQKWNLRCHLSKTEITNLERCKDESWRLTKQLGSLLGDDENSKKDRHSLLSRLESYQTYGKKAKGASKRRKINLYKALVFPKLTYNCGIWALIKKSWQLIDAHHRKRLRKLTVTRLYEKTKSTPISQHATKLRWSLLGYILRSDKNLPGKKAIEIYFKNIEKKYPGFKGRPRITLPTVFSKNPKRVEAIASRKNLKLSTIDDLTELRKIKNNGNFYLEQLTSTIPSILFCFLVLIVARQYIQYIHFYSYFNFTVIGVMISLID